MWGDVVQRACDLQRPQAGKGITMKTLAALIMLSSLPFALACSSSEKSDAPAGGGDSGVGCSCDITFNGAQRTIACGTDTCLNGVAFTCGKSADVSQGGACKDTGGSPDGGGGGGAGDTFACQAETCDSASQFCILSKGGASLMSFGCVPLPSGCHSCSCASDVTEKSWKSAKDGTANCTGATLLCSESRGGITVTCQK